MRHLTTAINAIMARHGMTAQAAAARSKITQSNLSRLLSSDQRPSHETARAIVSNLAHDRTEAEELAWAYLSDERELIGATNLVAVAPVSTAGTSGNDCAQIISSIRAALSDLEAVADDAQDAAARATLIRRRLAAAAGMSSPISYESGAPLGMVADAPSHYKNGRTLRRKA